MARLFSIICILAYLIQGSLSSVSFRISSTTGKSYTLKELADLPAYVIRNMLDFEDPKNPLKGELSSLLIKPNKTPQIYSQILTWLNGATYPRELVRRIDQSDIKVLVLCEDATLGPLFIKLRPERFFYYELTDKIDTKFKSEYIEYFINTINFGNLIGDKNYFDFNNFLIHFEITDFFPSFTYEGKNYNLKLGTVFYRLDHLLHVPYLSALKTIRARANPEDLELFDIAEDAFIFFTKTTNQITNTYDDDSKPDKLSSLLPIMDTLLDRIKNDIPVLISAELPGHAGGILIHKCLLFVFDRSPGLGPVNMFIIDHKKLTPTILAQLHRHPSMKERAAIIEKIKDDKCDLPLHPRVIGYQFSGSCTNEALKDLLWGVFKIFKLNHLYKKLMIEVRKIVWNDMLTKYHEFKNDPKKVGIVRIIKILLLSAHIQMEDSLNEHFPLPNEIIDEEILLECWCAFFYFYSKSSPTFYPSVDDDRPFFNMETGNFENTIGSVVREKLKSWENLKINGEEYLKKFALSKTYSNPVLRLLGNIFIQQGLNCSEIIKALSKKDIKLIRRNLKLFPELTLLDALSLSMGRNPKSSITAKDFTSLWELQYGKDWRNSVHGYYVTGTEMNFRISEPLTAKSIFFKLLWLQRSIVYERFGYIMDTYFDLALKVTKEMLVEIPQLAHAFQISEDFDLKSRPDYVFTALRYLFRSQDDFEPEGRETFDTLRDIHKAIDPTTDSKTSSRQPDYEEDSFLSDSEVVDAKLPKKISDDSTRPKTTSIKDTRPVKNPSKKFTKQDPDDGYDDDQTPMPAPNCLRDTLIGSVSSSNPKNPSVNSDYEEDSFLSDSEDLNSRATQKISDESPQPTADKGTQPGEFPLSKFTEQEPNDNKAKGHINPLDKWDKGPSGPDSTLIVIIVTLVIGLPILVIAYVLHRRNMVSKTRTRG
jgi:hypothetical protein